MRNELTKTGIPVRIKPRTVKMQMWGLACALLFILTIVTQAQTLENMEIVAENEKMLLGVNMISGEFMVRDKFTGYIWWSNPPERNMDKRAMGVNKMELHSQLVLRYYNTQRNNEFKINSHVGSVNRKETHVTKIKDGFRVSYRFPKEGFLVPLEVTLEDAFIKVAIPVSEIEEPDTLFITSLDLIPFFGAGDQEEEGYLFVPDGSGALISFNNGKQKADPFKGSIYGFDNTFQPTRSPVTREDVFIPVFGIKKQDHALIAIADQGASLGTINASISGQNNSYNNAYFEFKLRSTATYMNLNHLFLLYEKSKPKVDRIEVKYYFLSGEKANYVGMAEKYREFLVKEKGMKAKSVDGIPFYLDLYGAVRLRKSICGIPMYVNEELTTFKEIETLVTTMQSIGIDDIVINLRDWTPEKLKKRVPISVTPLNKLGGRKAFEDLKLTLKEKGVQFYPEFNFIDFNSSGNGFNLMKDSSINLNQLPALQFEYKRSSFLKDLNMGKEKWRLLKPGSTETAVKKYISTYDEKNISGIMLGAIPNKVYSDFSKEPSGRENTLEKWEPLLALLEQTTGGLMANRPNAYAFPYLDHIVALPVGASDFEIVDQTIPFIQVVIHGLIPYSNSPINLASNPEDYFLKAVESGSFLNYSWIYREPSILKETPLNHLYSCGYDVWLDSAAWQYTRIKELYELIKTETITNHSQIAPEVYETEYANGYCVVVNYNKKPVKVDDQMLAAKGFIFFKKGDN